MFFQIEVPTEAFLTFGANKRFCLHMSVHVKCQVVARICFNLY